jgi:hypothetical protein
VLLANTDRSVTERGGRFKPGITCNRVLRRYNDRKGNLERYCTNYDSNVRNETARHPRVRPVVSLTQAIYSPANEIGLLFRVACNGECKKMK